MLCACLAAGSMLSLGQAPARVATPALEGSGGTGSLALALRNPLVELAKLISAFLIGVVVTAVHRATRREEQLGSLMEQAQVLLCISGALMMLIIGDSLARAFGIAGAASIIRFRTPVENPKDTLILFLLLGLGMSCGLGAFAVAGLGTVFLCGVLLLLARRYPQGRRQMLLSLASVTSPFPSPHVQQVFHRHNIRFETVGIHHGDNGDAGASYQVSMDEGLPLEAVSAELRQDAGITSVVWGKPKKARRDV